MNAFIVENPIMNRILPLIMYIPDYWEVLTLLGIAYPRVLSVIKVKEARTG